VVAVLSDGAVENRPFDTAEDTDEETLAAATARLQAVLKGATLAELPEVSSIGDADIDLLCGVAVATLGQAAKSADHEHVFVGGPSRLAGSFDAIETVRGVLSILEQQLVVVSLLRDVLERGLSVAIGSEHGFEPLASCAVVVAPVEVDGQHAGAVGLLGPTRMNYPAALAAAEVVGRQLSDRLGADLGADRTNRGS